jgi:hypothetical protein
MDGHGIDGYGHARIKELVDIDRIALFRFKSDVAKAISGTVSGGFRVEKDEHVVTGFSLYEPFQNPISSVTYAASNCQYDSGAAERCVLEFQNKEADCCNTKDYANYFLNHFHHAF